MLGYPPQSIRRCSSRLLGCSGPWQKGERGHPAKARGTTREGSTFWPAAKERAVTQSAHHAVEFWNPHRGRLDGADACACFGRRVRPTVVRGAMQNGAPRVWGAVLW